MDWQDAILPSGWVWRILSLVLIVSFLLGLYRKLRLKSAQGAREQPEPVPPMGRRPDDPGVIVEGCLLIFILVVAVLASVVRAVVDPTSNLLLSAFTSTVGATVTWSAARKFFYSPARPIADTEFTATVKDAVIGLGPLLVALLAALFVKWPAGR